MIKRSYSTVFKGQSRDVGGCTKCYRQTSIRVCASCHSDFPAGIDGFANYVIAVVGARETGKSHYIAVLIQILKELNNRFNWTFSPLDDDTMTLYKDKFYSPLYLQQKPIDQTAGAKGNVSAKRPLVYGLKMRDSGKQVILAFFDSAGEDLESADNMRKTNKYIASASGIILLLDPMLMPKIRSEVRTDNLPDEKMIYYHGHIIDTLSNFLYASNSYNRTLNHSVPLAVTFSKIDMLRHIWGDEFERFTTPIYHKKNMLNLETFESNSDFIENWLVANSPDLLNGTQLFTKHHFFGISALGADPKKTDPDPASKKRTIRGGVKPMHVEDPFLWLLHANGLIPGR